MGAARIDAVRATERILEFDLSVELNHGIVVSNLAYAVASEMGLEESVCYELAIAGMLHDIGKLKLTGYIDGREQDPSSDRGTEICAHAFHSGIRGTERTGVFGFCPGKYPLSSREL